MKSINKLINNKNLDISINQNYIKALEENDFKQLIKLLKIEDSVAMKYTNRLLDVKEEFNNCKNCKSLCECKNKIIGYTLSATKQDNLVTFSYNICRYMKKESYKENVITFDIPKAIKNATIKDIYTNDKNRISIIKEIKKFNSDYNNNDKTKGIYLYGNFGCGKTYLIAALFNELAKKNISSIIVHTPELLRDLKDSFSSNYSEKFNMLKKTPLLLLDDIGAEYLTLWGRDEVLEPILQYRMDSELPTFFTSNFNLEELEKHFSMTTSGVDKVKAKRIIERIKQLSNPIELISKNLRD